MSPEPPTDKTRTMESPPPSKHRKLGVINGVYIPVVLNILSILMFLRFGSILGQVGLLGMLGLLIAAYFIDLVTTLSLSAIASNGEVKGGGAYYLISRTLGPEFGGSIGVLFYLSQVFNTALNVVGLIDSVKLNVGASVPSGYWVGYLMQTCVLVFCTALCLAGSGIFARASNGLLVVLVVATLSIPISAAFKTPFKDGEIGVEFTGLSRQTLLSNWSPHNGRQHYKGLKTFRELFGILFPATSGIFAGASMSGDLRNPSKAIPRGTLYAMLSTFVLYLLVVVAMASSITHGSFLRYTNVVSATSLWSPLIFAGECATTFFSVLMGVVGAAKLLQALARDKLLPGLSIFGRGTRRGDEPIFAVLGTYVLAQMALFADLNQIATLISMGYQMTFFVMNLACFLLKIGSAPNFRPAFKFFTWHSAFVGSLFSAIAMFFIDDTYAVTAICLLVFLFLLIHYMSPPKHWGDVSQNLIYHQVRKYLLRLKPEHIKFWRPQIILLINDPRHHTRLIQFCNSMKKGALYILGHVIVTDDFNTGIHEAKLQQAAWTRYISEFSKIKAFVQLTMSPTIEWGARNLILSAGLGGMRPNIAILGFYNMDELRRSRPLKTPEMPLSPTKTKAPTNITGKGIRRRRGDTSARLLEGFLPTDAIRTEGLMSPTSYLTILEDLALRNRLNIAIGKGFQFLETPRLDGGNTKKYIDLWPIQMSAEIVAEGKSVLTTNFDTYTLILQLGYILHSVPAWKKAFDLRILVFVEYENEIAEEQASLKALLEKLRIQAEVHVFCLASGQLNTYESIVNGKSNGSECDQIISELLKGDQWWQELQRLRHEAWQMSRSQELSSFGDMLEATRRRSSNPTSGEEEDSRRRLSVYDVLELPKKPTVSKISKLGVNFGIHTHHLDSEILDDQTSKREMYDTEEEDGESSSASDADFDSDAATTESDEDQDSESHHHASWFPGRRRSLDLLRKPKTPRRSEQPHFRQPVPSRATSSAGYGTMTSQGAGANVTNSKNENIETALSPLLEANRRLGGEALAATEPATPQLSGRSSRNRTSASTPRRERPPISRNPSTGRFSSRPVPETRIENEEGRGERITFAETFHRPTERRGPSRAHSRKNSGSWREGVPDVDLNIPELLDSYQIGSQADADAGSNYSTQSLPLSFNDLPSRAQHLILNDLMRQNSNDTAVLLTTLPIPDEGTCKSEEASLRYLSDIEVLCHELPPVLLVLSNNMTVTVSL